MYQQGSNVAALVRSAFRRYGFHELESVRCTAADGVVTLSGHVSRANLRRAAESIAKSVTDVRVVHNNIQIEASDSLLNAWHQAIKKMRPDRGNT